MGACMFQLSGFHCMCIYIYIHTCVYVCAYIHIFLESASEYRPVFFILNCVFFSLFIVFHLVICIGVENTGHYYIEQIFAIHIQQTDVGAVSL